MSKRRVRQRLRVYQAFGFRCLYCGRTTYLRGRHQGVLITVRAKSLATIDHIVPRSHGGTTVLGNLVHACRACTRTRGSEEVTASGQRVPGGDLDKLQALMARFCAGMRALLCPAA